MRAILILFDSLRRNDLPCYGGDALAPNFERLASRTAVFDRFFVGSLPCMPARRELHTGRYNFLHKGWSPLEPFDDSMPELLGKRGIHTHLVSDHYHYWNDGGAHYANRYSTYQNVRGQEGDNWRYDIARLRGEQTLTAMRELRGTPIERLFKQDAVNRLSLQEEKDHPLSVTFEGGLDFLRVNHAQPDWFLQIEAFDPHEPFFTYEEYRARYAPPPLDPPVDWPNPGPVTPEQDAGYIEALRAQYKALLTQCDAKLGAVLDCMDAYDMWRDTMLIVHTDHGLLLGEHGWWGKGVMPNYNEIAHIPFFIWDPESAVSGVRTDALAQTIDIAPTLLAHFGAPIPDDMQGRPLQHTLRTGQAPRTFALFGYHGAQINGTDGRYLYMRAPVSPENAPLYEYTLETASMAARADPQALQDMELVDGFPFTKGVPLLRLRKGSHSPFGNSYRFGNALYDLQSDASQTQKLDDTEIELRMLGLLRRAMLEADAPQEQFERVGLTREAPTLAELREERAQRVERDRSVVLSDIPWVPGAVFQYQALAQALHDPELSERFVHYARERQLAFVSTEDLLDFARDVVPPKQQPLLLYMLSLLSRTE